MICLNSTNIIVFVSGMVTSLVLGVAVTLAVLTVIGNRVNGLEEDLEIELAYTNAEHNG